MSFLTQESLCRHSASGLGLLPVAGGLQWGIPSDVVQWAYQSLASHASRVFADTHRKEAKLIQAGLMEDVMDDVMVDECCMCVCANQFYTVARVQMVLRYCGPFMDWSYGPVVLWAYGNGSFSFFYLLTVYVLCVGQDASSAQAGLPLPLGEPLGSLRS